MDQQLKIKSSDFQNILLLFYFFKQTINWICLNFENNETIKEIIIFDEYVERLCKTNVKKICRVCKYFRKFKEIILNNELDQNEKVDNFLKVVEEHLETFVEINDFHVLFGKKSNKTDNL